MYVDESYWSTITQYLHQFCHLCSDGGDHLFLCDSCPRATCSRCIPIPSEYSTVVLSPAVTYLCLPCHIQADKAARSLSPYQVSC